MTKLMLPLSLVLLASLASLPVRAQTTGETYPTSSEATDKEAFRSALAEKTGIYPKLKKDDRADWVFKAQDFSIESLKGQPVAYYVANIKHPEGPVTGKELATYYSIDIAPYVENGLKAAGLDLFRSPEAKASAAGGQSQRDLESGKQLKAQMDKNPQMAAAMKLRVQQDPNFAAQMRRMGITFDEPDTTQPQAAPSRPFAASPLDQKGYAVVLLLTDLRDVAAERQKGGFFSQMGKSLTALKTTSELFILKDGVPMATIRDTVAYQAGTPTRGSERLLAALR